MERRHGSVDGLTAGFDKPANEPRPTLLQRVVGTPGNGIHSEFRAVCRECLISHDANSAYLKGGGKGVKASRAPQEKEAYLEAF